MKKIFKMVIFGLVILGLSACGGVDDSNCCETESTIKINVIKKESTSKPEPTPAKVTGDEDNSTTTLPPVAIITPDIQFLVPGKDVEFDCLKSFDQDEQGDEIVGCIWSFKCFYDEKSTCNRTKEVNSTDKVLISPSKGAEYLEVTLTVIDDENQTDTTTMTYDIVE